MSYNIASLEDLIAELHKAFEGDVVDVDHVMQLMKSYKSNPADWKKYAKFDLYRYFTTELSVRVVPKSKCSTTFLLEQKATTRSSFWELETINLQDLHMF